MERKERQIVVVESPAALAEAAAALFVALAAHVIQDSGRFSVALSGGTTPKSLYAMLASDCYAGRVDWSRVQLFWGDERCVPSDDPLSNYRMVRETLIDHVPIPDENVHRIRGEDDPTSAAAAYEGKLRNFFGISVGPPMRSARFDLVLLGMGRDGHTASLFPGVAAVSEQKRWVMEVSVADESMKRITCTPVVFNTAASVVFLVAGASKGATLRQVLEGPHQPLVLPAQVIAAVGGSARWFVDADAASSLRHRAQR